MKIFNNIKVKKCICAIMALILTVAVFTACGESGDGGQYSENDVSTEFRNDYATAVDQSKSRIVYDMLDDPYEGVKGNSQPFDTNQYYFNLTKNNGSKYGIPFTGTIDEDYQQVVLCEKSSCLHIDETCPAHIDLIGGYFTIGDQLYFYSPSSYEYSTDSDNGAGNRIRLFSVDGGGKELFCEIQGYSQADGTVITDGKDLYLTAKNEKDLDIYIIKIDMSTATASVLYEMPARYSLFEYRICDITADGRQLIITARDFNRIEDYSVGVYSFGDNSFEIIKKLPADQYKIPTDKGLVDRYTIIGNYLYEFEMESGNITRQQLGKEEKEIIVLDARKLTDNPHHITFSHTYGDKVVLNCFAGEKHKLSTAEFYVLDTKTLSIVPLDIKAYNSMGIMTLIRVFSATSDYFVIATNTSKHSAMANEMALISKDNFYTNNYMVTPIGTIGY